MTDSSNENAGKSNKTTILRHIALTCVLQSRITGPSQEEAFAVSKIVQDWVGENSASITVDEILHGAREFLENLENTCEDAPDLVILFHDNVKALASLLNGPNLAALTSDLRLLAEADNDFSAEEQAFIETLENLIGLDIALYPASRCLEASPRKTTIEQVRIDKERVRSTALRRLFQVDAILPMLRPLAHSESDKRDYFLSQSQKVNRILAPRLHQVCRRIVQDLGIEEKIEFYTFSQREGQAFVMSSLTPEGVHRIGITAGILEKCTEDEIRFIIGHELGHVLYNTVDLNFVVNHLYPEFSGLDLPLVQLLQSWSRLAELSADRVGLLCVGKLDPAVTALYKVTSGLNPQEEGFEVEAYVEDARNTISMPSRTEFSSLQTHPPFTIRAVALDHFAKSQQFREWTENKFSPCQSSSLEDDALEKILRTLDYFSEDPLNLARLHFMALAGIMVSLSDGEAEDRELDTIRRRLSMFTLNPDLIIAQAVSIFQGEEFEETLRSIISHIIERNPEDRVHMMRYVLQVAIADAVIREEEMELLLKFAEILGIEEKMLGGLLIEANATSIGLNLTNYLETEEDEVDEQDPEDSEEEEESGEDDNDEIPVEELEMLAGHGNLGVRMNVFNNPNTPVATRLRMLEQVDLLEALGRHRP